MARLIASQGTNAATIPLFNEDLAVPKEMLQLLYSSTYRVRPLWVCPRFYYPDLDEVDIHVRMYR
jgi:hypothetical protein